MIEKYIIFYQKYPFGGIVTFIPLIPIIVCLLTNKSNVSAIMKLLLVFLVYDITNSFLSESVIIFKLYKSNNFFFNLYNLIEFLFFAAISYQLNHSKIQRKAILLMCLMCFGLFFYEFSWVAYGSILGTIEKAFLIVLVFFYFNTLLSKLEVENIYHHPPFWVHAGLMVYASISILNELATSALVNVTIGSNTYNFFWKTMQIATILFHLILAYSFWISKKETVASKKL